MLGIRQSHVVGLVVGALVGAAIAALSSVFDYDISVGDGLFWGAVSGSVLAGVPQFTQSGAVLTRRDNSTLNLVVGLIASMLFLVFVAGLASALTNLFF
jgi:hypothetical protein